MCLSMGIFANRPFALASGMGLNAVVAFSIIIGLKVPWQVGMSVIFVEGVVITLIVLTGLREAIMNAIPLNLKRAIGVGIGLFITFIGLVDGKVVVANPDTLVTLGDFTKPAVWVTLVGVFAIMAFMALKVKGDILWGILVATAAALLLGVTKLPTAVVAPLDFRTFGAPFQTVTMANGTSGHGGPPDLHRRARTDASAVRVRDDAVRLLRHDGHRHRDRRAGRASLSLTAAFRASAAS